MQKIKQLPPHEAQKIAAGEVVERPANVLKELVENSLDAGATEIIIYLEDAGKALIRIIDNGCGMIPQDAHMSVKNHATSKITTVQDLTNISTLGFRGEALSSISAVSKFTLITKTADIYTGVKLDIDNNITNESIIACNTGTEILIKDLFYNIPARKKFLKSKETELRTIIQIFYAFCLDYPQVHFKLFSENKLLYNCPSNENLTNRLTQLFDSNLADNLLYLENKHEKFNKEARPLKLRAYISNAQYTRYDRQQIFLFVNKRWVKNYKLSQAIIKGYQNILPRDKYPAAFLFLDIDTSQVDINIHPRKEEVQFLHSRIIEDFVEESVKNRLEQELDKNLGKNNITRIPAKSAIIEPEYNITFVSPEKFVTPEAKKPDFAKILDESFGAGLHRESQTKLNPENAETAGYYPIEYSLIGQVLQTYIIIQTQEGIVFVDQHAAHERIMYEQLEKNFNNAVQIKLLFPQIINLGQADINLINNYLYLFAGFGVNAQIISPSEIAVTDTPIFLKNQNLEDIFKQAIGWINELNKVEPGQIQKKLKEKIHAQVSCKSAIRAGDILTPETMHEIIKNLYKSPNKLTCPHGRPTIWVLSETEIEKKFKRDYR